MVRLSLTLATVSRRSADALLDGLRYLSRPTRLEPGCLGCNAWLDADWTVHYLEDWEREPDVRRRVLSDTFTSLLTVVEAAHDFSVQFQFVTVTRGLEYVTEARRQQGRPPQAGDDYR